MRLSRCASNAAKYDRKAGKRDGGVESAEVRARSHATSTAATFIVEVARAVEATARAAETTAQAAESTARAGLCTLVCQPLGLVRVNRRTSASHSATTSPDGSMEP